MEGPPAEEQERREGDWQLLDFRLGELWLQSEDPKPWSRASRVIAITKLRESSHAAEACPSQKQNSIFLVPSAKTEGSHPERVMGGEDRSRQGKLDA